MSTPKNPRSGAAGRRRPTLDRAVANQSPAQGHSRKPFTLEADNAQTLALKLEQVEKYITPFEANVETMQRRINALAITLDQPDGAQLRQEFIMALQVLASIGAATSLIQGDLDQINADIPGFQDVMSQIAGVLLSIRDLVTAEEVVQFVDRVAAALRSALLPAQFLRTKLIEALRKKEALSRREARQRRDRRIKVVRKSHPHVSWRKFAEICEQDAEIMALGLSVTPDICRTAVQGKRAAKSPRENTKPRSK
jgi:hypothetical protein